MISLRSHFLSSIAALCCVALLATSAEAQTKKKQLPSSWLDKVEFRSIGPANMMGRITAITVYEKDPSTWWAATASGGLLKTTNNGVTFEHQFDDQSTVSIGDVRVAQSNKDIIWVGTGESNPRNSVSWGDGVYKSTDGGKTWKNMGLKKTFQTGAIAIHPTNPDIVYVGSLGRLWGENPERGLFKTTDGGKTWDKILYVNDMTGVVDVQMNWENPDELLIATYERKRDGFDGNDPEKKYGEGSAIYKTTDGGKSFQKLFKGLPTCKLGRIGLDYFRKDHKYVYAIIETEKIAKEPEDSPFMGLRAEDADVGAKVTSVTKDGPCEKAGVKEDDIVVSVDGAIVYSYQNMMAEVRKHRAGDKIKLVVARDRKQVDIEVELAKKPAPRRRANGRARTTRTPFTGTLGGQAANLQDQQGEDGREYGGLYMSEDGGDSWKRINTLNPRPMYYSHIRVDPTDRNYIYVCGTSLYRSKDGGKTFTGDGGNDGIHVDHHALWIDSRDSRHMILGNDGGLYETYDRMDHWSHHNQVAIGQFYHVGVDATLNYKVYGGLQDNGSWGGPSRSMTGDGIVNSDWFRVGGGDGFVTLVDPEDPNQIYFESQNGGNGRINIKTGERGFIRPRPPRGTRYRFNWKTPFMLSPHNSKVYYSAGNYVFRSFNKGQGIKAISPEITNTDKGAGSAISESPREVGVLYVGTTDGAVWMTKDGGNNWTALYSVKEDKKADKKTEDKESAKDEESSKKEADPKAESKKEEKVEKDQPSASDEKAESDAGAMENDPITGTWKGKLISDRIPEDRADFEFKLKLNKDGSVSGEMENRRGDITEFDGGKFDPKTGAMSWVIESERFDREYSGTLKDGTMTGEMSAGGGRFQIEFEAKREDKDPGVALSLAQTVSFISLIRSNGSEDPISGTWTGILEDENLPGGRVEFTLELKLGKAGGIEGTASSPAGDVEITEGKYDAEKKSATFSAEDDEGSLSLVFDADVGADSMSGTLNINDQLEVDFDAERKEKPKAAEGESSDKKEDAPKKEMKAEAKETEESKVETADAKEEKKESASKAKAKEEKPKAKEGKAKPEKPAEAKPAAASSEDVISGEWRGAIESPQGESELTMILKRKSDSEITGTYETSRGEGEFEEGSYDPESKKLTLLVDNGNFTLEFVGEVENGKIEGEIDFQGGQFTMEFNAAREGGAQATAEATTSEENESTDDTKKEPQEAAAKSEKAVGKNSLAALMPGPRWVSSIEASRFESGRCYMSFDGHRSNDLEPYVFVTEDYGKNWTSIRANLPTSAGSVRVIREDVKNPNLLYLGCEFSFWFSIDRGQSWNRFTGMPTVAVHEVAVHPIAEEIVVGTHGRSLWIADISVLRQLTPESISADATLYRPKNQVMWQRKPARGQTGTNEFRGENPKSGVHIAYSLGKTARNIELSINDTKGNVIRRLEAENSKGLHVINWDMRRSSRRGRGPAIPSGDYSVELLVDGKRMIETFRIQPDPEQPSVIAAENEELEFWLELGEGSGD